MPISVDQIKEGQDIFFRCTVEANPKVYKIGWRHKVLVVYGAPKKLLVFSFMDLQTSFSETPCKSNPVG